MGRQLIDGFGRVHRDLRISVTDRCNFRCQYCMPEEGMQWTPRSEILTFEEIERVARMYLPHTSDWWQPFTWAIGLVQEAYDKGWIKNEYMLYGIQKEGVPGSFVIKRYGLLRM